MMIRKVFSWLNTNIGGKFNKFQIRKLTRQSKKAGVNMAFSIIAQNCVGGVMYHELGLPFLSPTINVYMESADFIKFCENLEYYLSIDANSINFIKEREYPVGYLEDIKIYFVHYKTEEEARKKWEDRKSRVAHDKICVVMTDRDGFNQEIFQRFGEIIQNNKYIKNEKAS